MSNQQTSVSLRGVERNKLPTLANDGSASYCHNLRPTNSGLELVKNKKLLYTFGATGDHSATVQLPTVKTNAENPTDTTELQSGDTEITMVYRHRALPKGYYLIVFNKRDLTLWKEKDTDHSVLEQVQPSNDKNRYNGGYPAHLDEDIISIGELNNILVVATTTAMHKFSFDGNVYSALTDVKPIRYTQISQAFDFAEDNTNYPDENDKKKNFFQAVMGFSVQHASDDKISDEDHAQQTYRDFIDRRGACLRYISALRAEEEADQKRAGYFVGHVLIRTAFKTDIGNYTQYGQIMHTEVGGWYGKKKIAAFSEDNNKRNPYSRVYNKFIGNSPNDVAQGTILGIDTWKPNVLYPKDTYEDKSIATKKHNEQYEGNYHQYGGLWPISIFNQSDIEIKYNEIAVATGLSVPPVLVGTPPYSVLSDGRFAVPKKSSNNERMGIYRYGAYTKGRNYQGETPINKSKQCFFGVYAPSIFYSYPVIKIFISTNPNDNEYLSLETLKEYNRIGNIKSLCIAMTAPVKHGFGQDLKKVNSITKPYNSNTLTAQDKTYPLPNELSDVDDNNYIDVYGYDKNPDIEPDKLMDKPFYVVKEIKIKTILDDIKKGTNIKYLSDGYEYTIPIKLNEPGVKITYDTNGDYNITTPDEVTNTDVERATLSNIEMANPLPTDEFSSHRLRSNLMLDYNRRLHLLGVNNRLFSGNIQTPSMSAYDVNVFNTNSIYKANDTKLFFEYELLINNTQHFVREYVTSFLGYKTSITGNDKTNMILNDILTYPDYRCKYIRLVREQTDGLYQIAEWECRASILNNIAYYANTTNKIPRITLKADNKIELYSNDFDIPDNIPTDTDSPFIISNFENVVDSEPIDKKTIQTNINGKTITDALYAYPKGDVTTYEPIIVSLNAAGTKIYRDTNTYNQEIDEPNRIQLSDLDDINTFPVKNSYRVGTPDNDILNVASMYGQVTEQKFGMYPLYIFTKEGIFTMEQGTGDVLYQSVSKINDDRLTNPNSVCNVGDMVAYMVENGLKLIQGKQSQFVGEAMLGKPYAIEADQDKMSNAEFIDDTLGSIFLYDDFNKDVLMLCPNKSTTGNHLIWAFNMASGKFFQRGDIINEDTKTDNNTKVNNSDFVGVVRNGKSLMWGGKISYVGTSTPAATSEDSTNINPLSVTDNATDAQTEPQIQARAAGIVRPPIETIPDIPDIGILLPDTPPQPDQTPTYEYTYGDYKVNLSIWDYNDADTLTPDVDNELNFTYVSNLYKLGINGYKHLERLVLRAFGNVASLKITLYGSLDGRKCYKIGESKDISAIDDPTLRRSPCSFVYFGFSIKGEAIGDGSKVALDDIMLQINSIDIELQQRYAAKLR